MSGERSACCRSSCSTTAVGRVGLPALEQQVDEHAIAAVGRHTSGRGVRLMDVAVGPRAARSRLRMVADDTPSPLSRASVCDGTGSPVAMYSRTSAASSRRDRSESSWETIAWQLLSEPH